MERARHRAHFARTRANKAAKRAATPFHDIDQPLFTTPHFPLLSCASLPLTRKMMVMSCTPHFSQFHAISCVPSNRAAHATVIGRARGRATMGAAARCAATKARARVAERIKFRRCHASEGARCGHFFYRSTCF